MNNLLIYFLYINQCCWRESERALDITQFTEGWHQHPLKLKVSTAMLHYGVILIYQRLFRTRSKFCIYLIVHSLIFVFLSSSFFFPLDDDDRDMQGDRAVDYGKKRHQANDILWMETHTIVSHKKHIQTHLHKWDFSWQKNISMSKNFYRLQSQCHGLFWRTDIAANEVILNNVTYYGKKHTRHFPKLLLIC